jgi:YidC/Oxa1 family membrane protein insertase
MTLTSFLENLLSLIFSFTSNYGLSIVLLSVSVNILLIPFYWFSEIIQEKERLRQDAMRNDLAALDTIENKNEKYFYTLEIYKRHNYKTYYSLVGTFGLLIQIPFFLAAYWLLQDYPVIHGESFSIIQDLSEPDGMLQIRWLKINVLPLLMTLINIIGVFQIRKNIESKQGLQLIFTAFVFLIFLYPSPASLLIYWTTNNIVSIGKNFFIYKNAPALSNYFSINTYFNRLRRFLTKYDREINFTVRALALSFLINHLIASLLNESQSSRIFLSASLLVLAFTHTIRGAKFFLTSLSVSFLLGFFILISTQFNIYFVRGVLALIYILILYHFKILPRKLNLTAEIFRRTKTHLILFLTPLIPALIYIFSNPEYFTSISIIIFVLPFFILPILIHLLVMICGRHTQTISHHVILANVIGLPTAFFLAPLITNILNSRTSMGSADYSVAFAISLVCFLVVMITSKIRALKIFIITSVLIIPIVRIVSTIRTPSSNGESLIISGDSISLIDNDTLTKVKPDIYLLVYDAYVDSEQLKRVYGIDNENQENFLLENGFKIIDNIYSLDKHSIGTMSSVLNMSSPSPVQKTQRKWINGGSNAHQILHSLGYFTQNIVFPYILRGERKTEVGFSYPDPNVTDNSNGIYTIFKSILIGEFKFNMEYGDHAEWRGILKNQISQDTVAPKFIYAHNPYPGHSQNSGTLLPNETELFEERLIKANQEMSYDINQILSQKKEAIIIIAGDHGPYLTGDGYLMQQYDDEEITRDHLQDRFGCFLAIRYPDSIKNTPLPKIGVLQDVLSSVFSILSSGYEYEGLNGSASAPLNTIFIDPAIKEGVINIGSDKGKPLYQ